MSDSTTTNPALYALQSLSNTELSQLLDSEEFYKKVRNTIGRKILYENQIHDKNVVEYNCSSQLLKKILSHIESVWTEYGATEPHWSVVSTSTFRSDVIDQNIEAFYLSGKNEAINLRRLLKRTNIDTSSFQSTLEYGCGVGRVTRWLADIFPQVYGADISSNHLSLAETYFHQENVGNITTFSINSLEDIKQLPNYDFLYSKIVFQHNPPPVMYLLLDTLCEKINSGGAGVFQIPTYCLNYSFSVSDYIESMEEIDRMEMHVLPQPVVFDILKNHNCHCREVSRDHLVATMDFVSSTFVFVKD
ncbi:MAG: hypothetical protein Kow00121_22280 [Elainellaceae cyanobacterium]